MQITCPPPEMAREIERRKMNQEKGKEGSEGKRRPETQQRESSRKSEKDRGYYTRRLRKDRRRPDSNPNRKYKRTENGWSSKGSDGEWEKNI